MTRIFKCGRIAITADHLLVRMGVGAPAQAKRRHHNGRDQTPNTQIVAGHSKKRTQCHCNDSITNVTKITRFKLKYYKAQIQTL